MDYFYKVEITIDEEKLAADGGDIDRVYESLCDCFYNDFFLKERNGSVFTFGTMNDQYCGMMWQRIRIAYKAKLKTYYKTMTWHTKPLGIVEDILAEWDLDYVYKFEVIVDEEKAIADGKDLDKVYAAIDSCFSEDGYQKKQDGSLVTYSTMDEEYNDKFLGNIMCLYRSETRPYLKSALWFNSQISDIPENVLKILDRRGG